MLLVQGAKDLSGSSFSRMVSLVLLRATRSDPSLSYFACTASAILFMMDVSSIDEYTEKGTTVLEESFKQLKKICKNALLKRVDICVLLQAMILDT